MKSVDARPLVSVIVPNYNHASFLPERFRSILAHPFQDFELIVLDDAPQTYASEVASRGSDLDRSQV